MIPDVFFNLFLFLLWPIVFFSSISILICFFSKNALILLMSITFIAANIQFLKEISLPLIPYIPLGSTIICANSFCSDILNQFYSRKVAYNSLKISLFTGLIWNLIFFYTSLFIPSARSISIDESFSSLFLLSSFAFISSYISYFLSQSLNIFLFDRFRSYLPILYRSLFSSFIASLLDYFLFVFLFYFLFKQDTLSFYNLFLYFFLIPYILRIFISFFYLPFLYILKRYSHVWLK